MSGTLTVAAGNILALFEYALFTIRELTRKDRLTTSGVIGFAVANVVYESMAPRLHLPLPCKPFAVGVSETARPYLKR